MDNELEQTMLEKLQSLSISDINQESCPGQGDGTQNSSIQPSQSYVVDATISASVTEKEDDFCDQMDTSTTSPEELKKELETDLKNLKKTLAGPDIVMELRRDGSLYDRVIQQYSTVPGTAESRIRVLFSSERGQDSGGVSRDMLTSFWKLAITKYFRGERSLIPHAKVHDQQDAIAQFPVLGRILSHSVAVLGRLPFPLSPTCILVMFKGVNMCSQEMLISDYLNHVQFANKQMLEKAINHWDNLDESEKEHLGDFMSVNKVTKCVRKENIRSIVEDIARRELIIQPSLYLGLLKSQIPEKHLGFWTSLTEDKLSILCAPLTREEVVNGVTTNELHLTAPQEETLCFLKDFIRSTSQEELELFLHMATGMTSFTELTVTFNRTSGLARAPMFHACGKTLELSTTYEDSFEFQREMRSVLKSENLKMTVI